MQVDNSNHKQRGLGRGLDALIPITDDLEGRAPEGVVELPIDKIKANPKQPRKDFKEEALKELSTSIKEHGVLQPLIVTKLPDGNYEVIAGERRLRASKMAGLTKVPVLERDVEELKKLELAITENVQRDDLNPIEEAYAYQELITNFSYSQEEVSRRIGISRSAVTNKLRLMSLPNEAKKAIREGLISEGHGRAILAVNDSTKMIALLGLIIKGKLSVREAEEKARDFQKKTFKDSPANEIDPNITKLEEELRNVIGLKVGVKPKKKGRGSVVIDYNSFEELDSIIEFFTSR